MEHISKRLNENFLDLNEASKKKLKELKRVTWSSETKEGSNRSSCSIKSKDCEKWSLLSCIKCKKISCKNCFHSKYDFFCLLCGTEKDTGISLKDKSNTA